MLLLKFTFCFFCCSLGCPLDRCTLRAKIMIASNFSWEEGWERVKSGLLSNIPTSQIFPVTSKIHADKWASRSLFCVKKECFEYQGCEKLSEKLELPHSSLSRPSCPDGGGCILFFKICDFVCYLEHVLCASKDLWRKKKRQNCFLM